MCYYILGFTAQEVFKERLCQILCVLVTAPLNRPDQAINSTRRLKLPLLSLAVIIASCNSPCAKLSPPTYFSMNQRGICRSCFWLLFHCTGFFKKAQVTVLAYFHQSHLPYSLPGKERKDHFLLQNNALNQILLILQTTPSTTP